jgi:flagellar FliL protein
MTNESSEPAEGSVPETGKTKRRLVVIGGLAVLLLAGGSAGAYLFAPGLMGKPTQKQVADAAPAKPVPPSPTFVDLPEMSVTLPNGGQQRQIRLRISLELVKADIPSSEVLSPKVYDMVLTYARTLNDAEIENSLAIDHMRGDLYRRLSLLLGPDVVRDVLITSFVVA